MSETVKAVTRIDRKRLHEISNPKRIPFAAEYSRLEFEQIRLGLRPEEMEDKWFIFFEDNVLYLHRSWTGFCIYRVGFTESGEKFSVTSVEVNRNEEQYKQSDDTYDARILGFLIDRLLLKKQTAFPLPPGMQDQEIASLYQYTVAGIDGIHVPMNKKPWWKVW